jgi:hypothetical protein
MVFHQKDAVVSLEVTMRNAATRAYATFKKLFGMTKGGTMKTAARRNRRLSMLGKFLLAVLVSISFLPFSRWTNPAEAAQNVYGLRCNPGTIFTGVPTRLRVTVQISYDPNLVSSSVNLLRIKPDGSSVVVSQMYDDGTHGDALKDDGGYTTKIEVNEPNPGTLRFQVSAGYKGQARRVLSNTFTLQVQPYPNLEEIWNQFVAKLVSKDMEGALSYMRDDAKKHYRMVFTEVGMDRVASDFRTARNFKLKEIVPDQATYTFTATIDGKDQQGDVIFWLEREWDDVWRIDSVGF